MKVLTEKEFLDYCEKGVCLRHTFKSKRCLLKSKQKACYKRYIALKEKKDSKVLIDERWKKVRQKVIQRDNEQCQVLKVIDIQDWGVLVKTKKNRKCFRWIRLCSYF